MSMKDVERYAAALHAVQSGVKWTMDLDAMDRATGRKPPHEEDETSPKHLRVGINSAKVEHSALVDLLVKKGLLDADEYTASQADAMEAEKAMYEQELSLRLGRKVTLG